MILKFYHHDYIAPSWFSAMTKMKCSDYGFDCDFIIEVTSSDSISEFGDHMNEVHGIEYQKEALMAMILNKENKKV